MRMQSHIRHGASRRGFLKAVGLVAGAAFLPGGAIFTGEAGAATALRANVALVVPRSNVRPSLGPSLASGVELGLRQAGGGIALQVAEVGPAPAAAAAKVRDLLADERVDLVLGALSPRAAAQLRQESEAHRTPLVVADAGADLALEGDLGPFIFHSTLGYWRASWASGQWAGRNLGSRAFVACSFYESGHDALFAFRRGLEEAGGCEVASSVTHVPGGEADLASTMAAIRQARPDFVYAMYGGAEAVEFLQAYAEAGLIGQIPLVGSPFLVDEPLLAQHGASAVGVHSALSWAPPLPGEANATFVNAFRAQYGSQPDVFALLGYNTAQLVVEALRAAGGDGRERDRLRDALAWARIAGPGGRLRMEMVSQSTVSPLYLREVRQGSEGLANELICPLAPIDWRDPRLEPLRTGVRSGWIHAYQVV